MPTARNRPQDFVARHAAPHHADPGSTRTPIIVTVVLLSLTAAAAIGLRAGSSPAQTPAPASFESASATPLTYAPPASPGDDTLVGDESSAASTSPTGSAAAVTTTVAAASLEANGIPTVALQAYQSAAAQYDKVDPGCRLPWTLLAAIGRVESDHGRFGGAVLRTDGTSTPPVIGPALNGQTTALVVATPVGITLDGDRQYDHAVGPMQIIPSTWTRYALAATGHSTASPFNIFDATATAARYLCVAGGDMGTSAGQLRAVFAYNHSNDYVSTVLTLENAYDSSFQVTGGGQVGSVVPRVTAQTTVTTASVPPANPGPPTAVAPVLTDPGSPTSSPTDSSSSSGAPPDSSSAPGSDPASPTVTPSTGAPTPPASSTPSTPSTSADPTSPAAPASSPTSPAPPASSSSSPPASTASSSAPAASTTSAGTTPAPSSS